MIHHQAGRQHASGVRAAGPSRRWLLLPREHGSWAMLLFPFVSAMVLTRAWDWALIPAAVAVLAAFLAREPLLALCRQRWLWTEPRPEAITARRTLWMITPVLATTGVWLLAVAPLVWIVALAAAATLLTTVYIYAALHNRQRSIYLQLAGSMGLSASCFMPYLALGRQPDAGLLLLWLAYIVHGTGSVLVVHSEIEARWERKAAAAVHPPAHARKRAALLWQIVHGVVAGVLLLASEPELAFILLASLSMHTLVLLRRQQPAALATPLRAIGFRELGISTVFSALLLISLW